MNLAPFAIQKFFDNAGRPLNGGLLFTYVTGETTKLATYTDSTGGTPNTNPIVLDFRGEARIWLDQTLTYRFVLAPANDTDPPTAPIWSVDGITAALTVASLTQQIIGQVLYPRSPAETLAGVNPVNFWYIYGNVLRYGTNTTPGTTDLTTAINNAALAAVATGGTGTIYHPGGQILHASPITAPNGITIYGEDRNACEFIYSGTGSGWLNVNPGPSGYAKVRFQGLKLTATNASNAGAAIEFNAGGYSYYQIVDCWLFNKWKYAIILDAAEIVTIERCLIDLAGTQVGQTGIWIVNGPDRTVGQQPGFSNVITIRDNQISGNGTGIAGTCLGIADDGGNNHCIEGNNLNNHGVPLRVAGTSNFALINNSLETHATTGGATAQFTNLTLGSVNVGQCINGVIHANGFFGDVSATNNNLIFISQTYTITNITQAASAVVTVSTGGSTNPFAASFSGGFPITFQGVVGMTQINGLTGFITAIGGVTTAWTATVTINSTAFTAYASGGNLSHYHAGLSITGNVFGYTVGRGSAMDVTQLANSFIGYNFDLAQSAGMGHYTGVHNDTLGNTLLPPQNGSVVSLGINGPTYGDSRYPTTYSASIVHKRFTVTYGANMALDLRTGDAFYVTPTNGTAFTFTYTNALDMNRFSVSIINTTGGALGAATWTGFKLGAAWAQPATGFRRTIEFEVDSGGVAHEINRSAADVTN